MIDVSNLLGRKTNLFDSDFADKEYDIRRAISKSSILILGGAGSIGQAVTKGLLELKPGSIHIVDISENNLVELIRDIRSSFGYIDVEIKALPLDIGTREYDAFFNSIGTYDFVLNFSALKHVRSEKDPFTLMRMIVVNVLNTEKTIRQSIDKKVKKYFCVSTDKAADPVNMMGGSKRIMEMLLLRRKSEIKVSSARFANVAFSDGSLLFGFNARIQKMQPLSAPRDIKRYFITGEEAAHLCLLASIGGDNCDIYFPKSNQELQLVSFRDIAIKYLNQLGYEPFECDTEDEARIKVRELIRKKRWPCYFFKSDTTGEKEFEEFYTEDEEVLFDMYKNIGVIKAQPTIDTETLDSFLKQIDALQESGSWKKSDLVEMFSKVLDNFQHLEKNKYLDDRM